MKVPDLDNIELPQVLAFLKEHDNEAVGLILASVAFKRAGDVNSIMSIVTELVLDKMSKVGTSQAKEIADSIRAKLKPYLDWIQFRTELGAREKAIKYPPGTEPTGDPTPIEIRLMWAALFYQIGKDPKILGEMLRGGGEILKGVGEIVPL
jgi:hypothetical protein